MTTADRATPMADELTRADGTVDLDHLLIALRLSEIGLALILGMCSDAVSKASRLDSNASQCKLRDLVEILV